MSRTDARRWLALGLAAFALRAATAVVTERFPVFPAYYYQDAAFAESIAWDMAQTWRSGTRYLSPYSKTQRAHAAFIAAPYALVGRHPLAPKFINAALGAASVVLLGLAFAAVVSPSAAWAAAAMVAFWPSHVFYTSQLFKEAPGFFLVFAALALLLPMLDEESPSAGRAAWASAALGLCGLLRSYVMGVAALALAAAGALAAARGRRRRAGAFVLAAALAAPLLNSALARFVLRPVVALTPGVADELKPLASLDEYGPAAPLWTARGLSQRRAQRQASDRAYAQKSSGREIGTQVLPDARFESWLDVALFLPGAAFTVLYQPLPGLYPLDGKLGRLLASLENLVLLLATGFAARGLWRRRDWTSAAAGLLLLFAIMTAGSAVFEFDLGSASRHKLLFLPLLFPFAAEELLRRKSA